MFLEPPPFPPDCATNNNNLINNVEALLIEERRFEKRTGENRKSNLFETGRHTFVDSTIFTGTYSC